MPRSTRRTTVTQPMVDKENRTHRDPSQRESVAPTVSSRKARHRLSTAELTRLEDVFRKETHPSRQQKKDLAAELGMDYKTVTIWFQNKRQTSKRGQLPVESTDRSSGRTRADSCLRSVSSPSLNATLGASGVDPAVVSALEGKRPANDGLNTITSNAIVRIKPLLDSLNALTARKRERSESTEAMDETQSIKDIDKNHLQSASENAIGLTEVNGHDQLAEQEQTAEKPVKWKRIRTLEWACERQAKRRKLSREGYIRLGSDEDGDPNNTRMDSALSLLSLASSTQVGPTKDVIRGASLLLSFKHSWRRK